MSQTFIRKTGRVAFHVVTGLSNFINGCVHCCVRTPLFLISEPVVERPIKILRFTGRVSETCEEKEGASSALDVDPHVSSNPWLDEAVVIDSTSPIPVTNETFDLIVSDSTFEHVSDATRIAGELDRVPKVAGWICARTPNRNGYVALMNRMIPPGIARLAHFLRAI